MKFRFLNFLASALAIACFVTLLSANSFSQQSQNPLARRVLFGAQFETGNSNGLVIEQVFPDTTASGAGFQSGDVLIAVEEQKIVDLIDFQKMLARYRAGDTAQFSFTRAAQNLTVKVAFLEKPRESNPTMTIAYGSALHNGNRLRTIVTTPKTGTKFPLVMFLQGGESCFSIESILGTPSPYAWLAQALTEKGFATLRVERQGCGDSEGGPIQKVDFNSELENYKAVLSSVRRESFIATDSVFLFGHSMGGFFAPLIAKDEPVKGIILFGVTQQSWLAGILDQRDRLLELQGFSAPNRKQILEGHERFWRALLLDRKPLSEIKEGLGQAIPQDVWDLWVEDDQYIAGRPVEFFQQIADRDFNGVWRALAKSGAAKGHPKVLAIWGNSDFLVPRSGSQAIVDIVNEEQPGGGTFKELPGVDHQFFSAASPQQSLSFMNTPPDAYNKSVFDVLSGWLKDE
jgi:uncharacterized protein